MIGQEDNKVSYNGNGSTTQFPFSFRILAETDIKLLLVDINGNETQIVSDYYVNKEQGVVSYPGYAEGTEPPEYDRPPILAEGERLVIYREVPVTQMSNLGDRYPFNVIEEGLDKLTIIAQQLTDGENRSIKISKASVGDIDLTIPVGAGKAIRWNEDGTGMELTEDPATVLVLARSVLEETVKAKEQALEEIEAEKQNIVDEVIAALPVYDGEVIKL